MPLSDEDKQKYKDLYLQTAKPYVSDLEKIAALDINDKDQIETIHRAAHSLGSQSLMMEYNSIAHLSRLIEKIFKSHMDEGFVISDAIKDEMVKVVARMKESVAAIETNDAELDLESEKKELESISKITV